MQISKNQIIKRFFFFAAKPQTPKKNFAACGYEKTNSKPIDEAVDEHARPPKKGTNKKNSCLFLNNLHILQFVIRYHKEGIVQHLSSLQLADMLLAN